MRIVAILLFGSAGANSVVLFTAWQNGPVIRLTDDPVILLLEAFVFLCAALYGVVKALTWRDNSKHGTGTKKSAVKKR